MRRIVFPLILGVGGVAILLALGFWQVQRLEQKQALLDAIEVRIGDVPVDLPAVPDPKTDQYLPVKVSGDVGAAMLRVLSGQQFVGSGFRIISPMQVGGRMILVDRGFVPDGVKIAVGPAADVTITGNLQWPNESDSYTPPPDLGANFWFARDVPAMAAALGTEQVMIVVRDGLDDGVITPSPVGITGILNNHKEYAITWFSLALVWAGMTVFLLWRIRQRKI